MGMSIPHVLGRQRRTAAVAESTYGEYAQWTSGADFFRCLDAKISEKITRFDRDDGRETRGIDERTTGKAETTFSVETYVNPNAAGTPPDIDVILKNAWGPATISAGVSTTYALSSTQGVHTSFSLTQSFSDVIMEAATGCMAKNWKLSMSAGERPKLVIDGAASRRIVTGYTTLKNAVSAASAFHVANGDHNLINVGSIVKIGTSDGSGIGHKVLTKASLDTITVVGYSNGTGDTIVLTRTDTNGVTTAFTLTEGTDFAAATSNNQTATNIKNAIDALEFFTATVSGAVVTVNPDSATTDYTSSSGDATAWTVKPEWAYTVAATISQSAAVAIIPYAPTMIVGGSPISGILGALTVDGVSLLPTAFELTNAQNHELVTDQMFEQYATDAIDSNEFAITGSITCRARRDHIKHLAARNTFRSKSLVLRAGPAASRNMTVNLPAVEFEFGDLEAKTTGPSTFTVPFKVLGDGATLVFA